MNHPQNNARVTTALKRFWPAAAPLLAGLLLSASAGAEPFVVEDMPTDFDGLVHPTMPARAPVAVDFNGDGEPSWYAGGGRVAHPKQPNPIDPLRYASVALPAISLPVCPVCTPRNLAFAVADVTRDGHPDIVRLNRWVGQSDTFTLQVFVGNGTDGFTLGWRFDWVEDPNNTWGDRYFQIALRDFDRDGDPDLAMLSTHEFIDTNVSPWRDRGRLSIRWNQNGEFTTEAVLQSFGFSGQSRLLPIDFQGDGDVDLLVNEARTWTAQNTFSRDHREYLNDGAGAFTMNSQFSDEYRYATDVVDLDRDAFGDLLVKNAALGWAQNSGPNGGFLASQSLVTGVAIAAEVVADLNEDDRPDIVTAEPDQASLPRRLFLRRAQASSTPGFPNPELLATMPSDILQISPGDARGDADVDLLVRLANGRYRLLRNQAQRLLPNSELLTAATGLAGLTRLAVADMNRDGIDDLLALQPSGPRLYRLQGGGNSNYNAEFKILASGPNDFAVGDFNRDGQNDLAYVVPGSGAVRTVTQIDNIFFSWTDSQIATYDGAALIRAGHAVNYNGTLDLLVASSTSGGLRWLRNVGGAQSWTTTDPVTTQNPIPQSLALAPLYSGFGDAGFTCSADGVLNINGYSNVLGWFRSARLLSVQSVTQPGICAMVNLDNDAELEAVFVEGGGRLVWWKPDNNEIVTTTTIASTVSGQVRDIVPVDWNRDGLNDLLVVTSQGLFLYARSGITESWSVRSLQTGSDLVDVAVIDANRDSLPDAAFIQGSTVRIRLNRSLIGTATGETFPSGQPLQLQPGQSGIAFDIGVANPGRLDEDANIAVINTRVTFNRAQQSGGIWSMGPAMTRAEVEQAVASVSLLVDGQVVGTTGTGAVDADGRLQINYVNPLGAVVPIAAASTRQMSLRVNLKSSAASASYTSFYLVQSPGTTTAQVLHAGQAVGKTTLIEWPLLAVSNRVSFEALPPLGDAVFTNSFEN
ncbi:MAG: VCBS repeat-containing protein [Ahniella sp.]|nr:VCBS repeat-containing protein [Ahniella sp.]